MSDQETPHSPAGEEQKKARQPERTGTEGREGHEGRESRDRNRGRRRHSAPPQRSAEHALNMDELRELVELINEYGFTDFELENKDVRVRLRRELAPQVISALPPTVTHAPAEAQAAQPPATSAAAADKGATGAASTEPSATTEDEGLHMITAPIVGTFYRSPSPTAESFVSIGSQVKTGGVVCIIEAMKLMNEIEADMDGVITKIYVENGQPVEYGQPLFGIKMN
jgi:acetyl-CoA carboxylase biotin carboxyl carrier protein